VFLGNGILIELEVIFFVFFLNRSRSERAILEQIFENVDLVVKQDYKDTYIAKRLELYRLDPFPWGREYAYKIPLGLSFSQIEEKIHQIQDGLNYKVKGHQKRVELSFDGMVRIKVYDSELPKLINYTDEILELNKGWNVVVGKTFDDSYVYHSFEKVPHLVIGGMTRYGKTVAIQAIVGALIYAYPDHTEFIFIDLKGMLSMQRYQNITQTIDTASNVEEALASLYKVEERIQDQLMYFRQNFWEDVQQAEKETKKRMKRIFIIVDEGASLASAGVKGKEKILRVECERILSEIARVSGGLGFRLIYCTQYPTADVIPRQVKQNADATLAFKCRNEISSRVLLDRSGAEKLPHGLRGRAIYQTDKDTIIQVPLMSKKLSRNIIEPYERSVIIEHEDRDERGDTLSIG
jgi:S-DNA-T family DNA segregation ATPase FtsK/SpoIIIE